MKFLHSQVIIAAILLTLGQLTKADQFDWYQWKGPDQNGISQESNWDPQALSQTIKVNWQKNVGPGYSSVSVYRGHVYTLGYDTNKKKNVLYCLRVSDGKKVWSYAYPATRGRYKGPRATPVIDSGRVYTLSQDALFLCHDAKTGKVIWKKDLLKAFDIKKLRWQISSSVLIDGNLAIVNVLASGLAVDKATGKVVWKSKKGKGNYATPVSFTWDGQRLAALFGHEQLNIVEVATGKVKWTYPWQATYGIMAADPVVIGKQIFVSTGYGNGCMLLDFSGKKPTKVWSHDDMSVHFSTIIVQDGYLYGIDGNAGTDAKLKCLDLKNGRIQWQADLGFGNMMAANDHLIMVNEQGTVSIIKMNAQAYQLVAKRENVIGRLCWTMPVLSNGALYIRNDKGKLISLAMTK